jgi:hypothetical protein
MLRRIFGGIGMSAEAGHVAAIRHGTLENTVKKLVLSASLALCASTAFAGGLVEPVMEPAVVEAKTSSSAGGILIPLLLLLLVAAAASSSSSSGGETIPVPN